MVTPSAAARSGLTKSIPPEARKFPGVIGVPSGKKKILRGPSELNVSTGLVVDPTNGVHEGHPVVATLTAAIVTVLPAAL